MQRELNSCLDMESKIFFCVQTDHLEKPHRAIGALRKRKRLGV